MGHVDMGHVYMGHVDMAPYSAGRARAMSEERESIGRIEVAPEVLATIAHYATLRIEGVLKMAPVPSDVAHLLRRNMRHNGVVLNFSDGKVKFNIYVIMDPHVNIMQTSRRLQAAVIEAIDTMVGIPVEAVNVHVEDVLYAQGETI
jgi:uncharacterized alkaline shock family protein YloU